jgi:Tfp pilus assembly protein PilV
MVEVMGAVLCIGLGLSGLFAANSRALVMLKSSKQAAVASKCLQQRIEQLRSYNWTEVTDSQSLQDLYAVPPLPSIELPGFSEKVIVSAFTPATSSEAESPAPVAPFLTVARGVDGTVTLLSDAPDLIDGTAVRVDVQITWPGRENQRMRETSVVISNGGIGR